MNAGEILDGRMTLDEKLAAIDAAMAKAQVQHKKSNPAAAPLDPADLTACEGCQ